MTHVAALFVQPDGCYAGLLNCGGSARLERTKSDSPTSEAKARNKPTLGKREANATPLAFRDELLKLALHSVT